MDSLKFREAASGFAIIVLFSPRFLDTATPSCPFPNTPARIPVRRLNRLSHFWTVPWIRSVRF